MRRTWKHACVFCLKFNKSASSRSSEIFKKNIVSHKFYLFFNRHKLKETL